MQLVNFRIFNFRSIDDSSDITVSDITTLVGRNESGKSNLLLALHSLNPAGGPRNLSSIKDFPRHRRLTECTDDTPVVSTTWDLEADERAALETTFPRAAGVKQICIKRSYKADRRTVELIGLAALEFPSTAINEKIARTKTALLAAVETAEEAERPKIRAAIEAFSQALGSKPKPADWAKAAAPALAAVRKSFGALAIPPAEDAMLIELGTLADKINGDIAAESQAHKWAIDQLPIFVYVDDYPELHGHQSVHDYLARKSQNQLTDADRNFEKMCKVADISPQQLQDLHTKGDAETRNQLVNRSSAIVTSELRRLWKDRPLKVRFNVDAHFLDTFISDPNATYEVDVNLDERSRGFKWFFAFYMTFAADTKGGASQNAILLLDEPGLYLHMTSQADLLRHFSADFENQIIYTTHSPFMIPTENLDAIRTVNIDQTKGTTVTNDPTGDTRTLFPLQAALGYHLAQSLFIGPNNLVIEGVTDYWILSTASEYLRSLGRTALDTNLTMTPAGGAQKITYMVALLSSQRLNVMALLDHEREATKTKEEMVKSKLIRDDNVTFVAEAFEAAPDEADIEDLLDPAVYKALIDESYKSEAKLKTIKLNPKIPRIAKRYEAAFQAVGLEFHKTRPARLLLNTMAKEPKKVMTDEACERFERLFGAINARLAKHLARGASPFS